MRHPQEACTAQLSFERRLQVQQEVASDRTHDLLLARVSNIYIVIKQLIYVGHPMPRLAYPAASITSVATNSQRLADEATRRLGVHIMPHI